MRWDPFSDFASLREMMDRVFEDVFVQPTRYFTTRWSGVRALPLDMYETKDAVIVRASVPGVNPEDVDISIDQGVLTIRGRVPSIVDNEQAKEYTWYLHEMGHGDFARSVTLSAPVDAAKAEATYDRGILTLTIPKAEEAKPKQIKIRTSPVLESGKA
jgi:HSP20 family protein